MTDRNIPLMINGRNYAWPKNPVVVVCIDGSEPAYIEKAIKAGQMPFAESIVKNGTDINHKKKNNKSRNKLESKKYTTTTTQ